LTKLGHLTLNEQEDLMNTIKVFPGHRSRLSALCDLIRCMNASTYSISTASTRSTTKNSQRPPKNQIYRSYNKQT
jgi:hypothetical protein